MKIPVFDLHCDTALALLGEDLNQPGNLRKNSLHIDLERASELSGYCQCFACFTTPEMSQWHNLSPIVIFEREIATIQRDLEMNKDKIRLAYSVSDIEGKATTIGTTFYQAILNIVKENIHKDLITYPPIYYFPQTGEYQVL